ncbi:MAG: hypothetical protein ACXVJO_00225 [Thermoanaerobaculia bacterium]
MINIVRHTETLLSQQSRMRMTVWSYGIARFRRIDGKIAIGGPGTPLCSSHHRGRVITFLFPCVVT